MVLPAATGDARVAKRTGVELRLGPRNQQGRSAAKRRLLAIGVLVAAFGTPLAAGIAAAAPASADTVINGCTIVANPTPTNFTDCPGADLSGANLSGVNLSFANLDGAQFAGDCVFTFPVFPLVQCKAASLSGANLTGADLSSASFAACASFINNLVVGCGSSGLSGADLTDTNLANTTWAACVLEFFGLSASVCSGADLSGANLSSADLTGATIQACLIPGIACTSANLTGTNLTGTIFVPSDQTVLATSSAGAVVTYSIPIPLTTATPTSCSPPSGSTFAIGTTTVTCTVFDDQGDQASGTFLVTVLQPTSTNLSSLTNPSVVGQPVTYTATVSPTPPGGTVSFTDNGSPIAGCSAEPVSGASASCPATPGTTGAHNLVATYSGSGGFLRSTSPSVTQVVTRTPCNTLAGCNLSGLNLSDASLAGADFQGANLRGANLSGANLSGANLTSANLNSANLPGASVAGANLSGANFKGANLTGANLTGASVSVNTNFTGVTWSNTTCPDGTNSDGGTCIGHL